LSCFRFKLPFADRYREIFIRIYPFSMDQILPTVFRFWLSRFRYRPNKNLYERKWWESFPDRFKPFSPLPLKVAHPRVALLWSSATVLFSSLSLSVACLSLLYGGKQGKWSVSWIVAQLSVCPLREIIIDSVEMFLNRVMGFYELCSGFSYGVQ
jgi:hypothetical protein